MARSNKYASLNFNEIFEKKLSNNINPTANSSFSSPSFAFANRSNNTVTNSKIHGHMLVLSRPPPTKPVSNNQSTENKEKGSSISSPPPPSADRNQTYSDPESVPPLPQDRTRSDTLLPSPLLVSPVKSDKFIPPHLRPGFVRKEEDLGSELAKGGGSASFKAKSEYVGRSPGPVQGVGGNGSRPNRYGEEVRPKSGGGYGQVRRGGEPTYLNRSGPSENRPSSSG